MVVHRANIVNVYKETFECVGKEVESALGVIAEEKTNLGKSIKLCEIFDYKERIKHNFLFGLLILLSNF